jgi:tetratricopeptide (TPR) repeat protein
MKKRTLILMAVATLVLGGCASISTIITGAGGEFDTGMGYFNQGKYQEAAARFAKATELDPEYGEAFLYLGRSYINLGRWGEALNPLRTAYRLAPTETRNEIGSILFDALLSNAIGKIRQGNFTEGISNLEEGMNLEPESGEAQSEMVKALIGYGGQLLQDGNADGAIGVFQEALGYNQANMDIYTGLARAFLMSGDWAKAQETALRALRLYPDSSQLQQLFQQLLSVPR